MIEVTILNLTHKLKEATRRFAIASLYRRSRKLVNRNIKQNDEVARAYKFLEEQSAFIEKDFTEKDTAVVNALRNVRNI